jgi:hypothetical protein
VIGAPLHTGETSEVIPVAPRADVRAPLVMERLLQSRATPDMREEAEALGTIARSLGPAWQRLISSEFTGYDAQYIYERFVGVTLRDLSLALRNSGRALPLDVVRTIAGVLFDGFASLSLGARPNRPLPLTDRSVGLGIDGQWRFAIGGLNHWLADVIPPELVADPEYDGNVSPDTLFFFSPESVSGRIEHDGSVASRAALLLWQLVTGGFHPYRGSRFAIFPSLTRYTRSEVRVPVEVHPQMTPALARVLGQGVLFSGERFTNLDGFREALDAVWPSPPASRERTFDLIASLAWSTMQKQIEALKREPMLPIRWDGVWSASRTPEEGLAVLEDQLLERLITVSSLPSRGPLPEQTEFPEAHVEAPPAPTPPLPPTAAVPPRVNLSPRRTGLLARLLAFFGR